MGTKNLTAASLRDARIKPQLHPSWPRFDGKPLSAALLAPHVLLPLCELNEQAMHRGQAMSDVRIQTQIDAIRARFERTFGVLDAAASCMQVLEKVLIQYDDAWLEPERNDAIGEVVDLIRVLSEVLKTGLEGIFLELPLHARERLEAAAGLLRGIMVEYGFRLSNEPDRQSVVDQLVERYHFRGTAFRRAVMDLPEMLLATRESIYTPTQKPDAIATEHGGDKHKNRNGKRKRGGQVRYDEKQDQKLADSKASGAYKTYADLAKAHGMSVKHLRQALDRVRKRESKRKPAAE